jgi:hypothetical protein
VRHQFAEAWAGRSIDMRSIICAGHVAHAAITGGVPQALEHGFVRSSEQKMFRAALALRDLQNFFVT